MKAHLIKSGEVSPELFTKVVELLQAVNGPIQFSYFKQSLADFECDDHFKDYRSLWDKMTSRYLSWKEIFKECEEYREDNRVKGNEFVILLTHYPNSHIRISALDNHNPYNGFVHTSDWKEYVDFPTEIPIAYEVLALMLQKYLMYGFRTVLIPPHEIHRGCINDFCYCKIDLPMKIKSASICQSCLQELRPDLSIPEVHHAFKILKHLREKMLTGQKIMQQTQPSRLYIDKHNKIFLTDFDNIEIKLRPIEKALFLFFLQRPEGVFLSDISLYKNDLQKIYYDVNQQGARENQDKRIEELVNITNDKVYQKLSRIQRAFEESLGDSLAEHYYIKGGDGQVKKIGLERGMVSWEGYQ